MDIFKQKRNLVVTIIILVVMNIITLLLLWFGRPKYDMAGPPKGAEQNSHRIQKLLREELGFNENQAKVFIGLRNEHRKKIKELEEGIRKVKKEMFDNVILDVDDSSISDSLLNVTLKKQEQIERLTFQHFLDLKKMCNKEQKIKLQQLMHRLFGPPPQKGPADHRPGPK